MRRRAQPKPADELQNDTSGDCRYCFICPSQANGLSSPVTRERWKSALSRSARAPSQSPHRASPPDVPARDHGDGRSPGSRVAALRRLPSGLYGRQWHDGARLTAYSCGGSRSLGPEPSLRSLLIPEGNHRANCARAAECASSVVGDGRCASLLFRFRAQSGQLEPWSQPVQLPQPSRATSAKPSFRPLVRAPKPIAAATSKSSNTSSRRSPSSYFATKDGGAGNRRGQWRVPYPGVTTRRNVTPLQRRPCPPPPPLCTAAARGATG